MIIMLPMLLGFLGGLWAFIVMGFMGNVLAPLALVIVPLAGITVSFFIILVLFFRGEL